MALSGTISNTFRTGYAIRIAWTISTQDNASNTSSVTASVQLVSLGSSYNINASATKSGSLTINGTSYPFSFNATLSGNETKTLFTKTVNVVHNSDGSKTCAFSCSAGINVTISGTYYGTVTATGSGVFDNIPRNSTIASITSNVVANGTNAVSISITRHSSSYTHTIHMTFGEYSHTLTNITTSASYIIPMTWLNAIPNGVVGYCGVTLTTYSGGTQIGNSVSTSFTVSAPDTVKPTTPAITASEATAGISSKFAGFVQGKTTLSVSVSASGSYSSTIKSYKTNIDGISYDGASFTTQPIKTSGSVTITTIATDSRGRSTTGTKTITVIPYDNKTIGTLTAYRSTSSGTQDDGSTYLTTAISFSISPVNDRNDKSYTLQHKLKNASEWTTVKSASVYSFSGNMTSEIGILGADNEYDVRLAVTDYFGTSYSNTVSIGSSFTLLDFRSNGRGIAFGKVASQDAFESALKIIASNGFTLGNTDISAPASITVTLGGRNFTKTTADYQILPMTSSTSYGGRLSLSGNAVIIGSGVKKIRVCAQACFGAATAGLKTCAIWTNRSGSHIVRAQMNITNASLPETICLMPRVFDVSEGDQITLRVYGTANDIIYGGHMQTFMTVEVVE